MCSEVYDAHDVWDQQGPYDSCPPAPKALLQGPTASEGTKLCPACFAVAVERLLTFWDTRPSLRYSHPWDGGSLPFGERSPPRREWHYRLGKWRNRSIAIKITSCRYRCCAQRHLRTNPAVKSRRFTQQRQLRLPPSYQAVVSRPDRQEQRPWGKGKFAEWKCQPALSWLPADWWLAPCYN